MNHISRRAFGGLLASGASLAVLASTTPFAFADSRLRLIWWGNPDRDKRTNEVVDLYQKANAGVTIDPRDLCLERLLAEARHAGGRAEPARRHPDGLPLHLRIRAARPARRSHAASSARRSTSPISIANQLESGKVDGKLYGISMGANSMTHVYRKPSMLKQLGADAARSDEVDDRRLRRAWARR